jgi:hypothetical protein
MPRQVQVRSEIQVPRLSSTKPLNGHRAGVRCADLLELPVEDTASVNAPMCCCAILMVCYYSPTVARNLPQTITKALAMAELTNSWRHACCGQPLACLFTSGPDTGD